MRSNIAYVVALIALAPAILGAAIPHQGRDPAAIVSIENRSAITAAAELGEKVAAKVVAAGKGSDLASKLGSVLQSVLGSSAGAGVSGLIEHEEGKSESVAATPAVTSPAAATAPTATAAAAAATSTPDDHSSGGLLKEVESFL